MTDEPGILGNLPRSRPGRRSERRDAGAGGSKRAEGSAGGAPKRGQGATAGMSGRRQGATDGPKRQKTTAEAPKRGQGARTARAKRADSKTATGGSARRDAGGSGAKRSGEERDAAPGLVTGAARAAGDVASAGVRVASRLTSEALRRLPRP